MEKIMKSSSIEVMFKQGHGNYQVKLAMKQTAAEQPKLRAAPNRAGTSSGCRRLCGAADLTDEFRIRDVNVMGGEELHVWLTGYARFLHSRSEPFFLKFLKRLLRFPDVEHVECA
jgi:hypothetical protein